ncbi:hypothetical protein HK405_006262, partial [Cladochytrium tenue]
MPNCQAHRSIHQASQQRDIEVQATGSSVDVPMVSEPSVGNIPTAAGAAPAPEGHHDSQLQSISLSSLGYHYATSGQEGQGSEPAEGYEQPSGAIPSSAAQAGPSELAAAPQAVPPTTATVIGEQDIYSIESP